MSRSVGDVLAKKAGVVAEPEVTQFVFDPQDSLHLLPRYVVLASDGIWDVMSNEQVAEFCCDKRWEGKSTQKIADSMIKHARQRWLQAPANVGVTQEQYADIDDISVVILKLEFVTN